MQKRYKKQGISSKQTSFVFRAVQVTSWNKRSFLEFPFRGFRFLKYKNFFRGFRFPKYKKSSRGGFLSFFELGVKSGGFHFRKYKKSFLLKKYKKSVLWENTIIFLILELESSISGNIRNFFRGGFFWVF